LFRIFSATEPGLQNRHREKPPAKIKTLPPSAREPAEILPR
jgi:hypothetical protein